jgi:hypothetical protein
MKWNQVGRSVLMVAAGFTAVGGFVADWNKTHLFNPRWTPHAKFHDAMTILLGAMLGTGSLMLLRQKGGGSDKQLLWAATLPAFFWAAMAGSFAFPGAKGIEAEFPEKVKWVGRLPLNEGPASALLLSLLALGYGLAIKK